MKRWIPLIVAVVIGTGAAVASSIKTWSTGEVINPTDLNGSFSHIHSTMVGGHGARLINADVSTSAAIAHSKLATPALLPRAWASVNAPCTSNPCTIAASSGVSGIAWGGVGVYTVTLTTPRLNANYAVFITPIDATAGANTAICASNSPITTGFDFECYENDAGGAIDTGFAIMILDNDGN